MYQKAQFANFDLAKIMNEIGWKAWERKNHQQLYSGKKLNVSHLPHPEISGFHQIDIAENHGQRSDYGLSLSNNSRIHVWECPNGDLIAHLDKHDPDANAVEAINHVLHETKFGGYAKTVGKIAIGGVAVYGACKILEAIFSED